MNIINKITKIFFKNNNFQNINTTTYIPNEEKNEIKSTFKPVKFLEKYKNMDDGISNSLASLHQDDKISIVVKGTTLGDSAGRPFEGWWSSEEIETKIDNTGLYDEINEITDDTALTWAILSGLRNKTDEETYEESFKNELYKYGFKYTTFGYGPGFITWLYSGKQEPYNSYGNGSAMRVSSCGCFDNIDDVIEIAKLSAMPTHNHPEGIKGAVVTAVCIWMAFNGATKEDIYEYALEQYSPEEYEVKINVPLQNQHYAKSTYLTCQGTIPRAIRAFYESKDYEDCIRKAILIGGDTDTQAAIAGSIASASYKNFNNESNIVYEKILNKYKKEQEILGIKG